MIALASRSRTGHYALVDRRGRQPQPHINSWQIASNLTPIVLGVGLLFIGFGIGTTCTNVPGNGSLNESPCDRVGLGIKLNLVLQTFVWLAAAILAWRSRDTTWVTRSLVAGSVAIFAVSLVVSASY
jgi:hypothetical protein